MTEDNIHIEANAAQCILHVRGDWRLGHAPDGATIYSLIPSECKTIVVLTQALGAWDSSLVIALVSLARLCATKKTRRANLVFIKILIKFNVQKILH